MADPTNSKDRTLLESTLRESLNNDEILSDEAIDALLDLSDLKRAGGEKMEDETLKLLEAAWQKVDGGEPFKITDKASALAELNTEALPSLDVNIPNQNVLASSSYSANWHESFERGKALDQVSSVWRTPENYGSLLSAITMMECEIKEKQVKGLLEATHPDRNVIYEAKRLGIDNAEVAQSMMMVALKEERDAAMAKGSETSQVLNHAVASNQELTLEIERLNEELVKKAGSHVASYSDLKSLFCKLMAEREASIQKHSLAMETAQLSLNHMMNDKSELLKEIESLYTQLEHAKAVRGGGGKFRSSDAIMGEQSDLRAERIAAKKKEKDLEATINYLKAQLEKEKQSSKKSKEDSKSLMERYQTETSNKIKLLEESIRLQDESTSIASDARNQIRQDIQSKFDKQLRSLLTEIEELEERNADLSSKYNELKSSIDNEDADIKKLQKENARLTAENQVLMSREQKRKLREEKMAELAQTLMAESQSNEMLAQRLKESKQKLDEMTRRGLVATTVSSIKSHALDTQLANAAKQQSAKESSHSTSSALSRRLPPPSIAGGSGARSSEFNDEIQRKLDGLTSGSLFSSSFDVDALNKEKALRNRQTSGLNEATARPPPFPTNKQTRAINDSAPSLYV